LHFTRKQCIHTSLEVLALWRFQFKKTFKHGMYMLSRRWISIETQMHRIDFWCSVLLIMRVVSSIVCDVQIIPCPLCGGYAQVLCTNGIQCCFINYRQWIQSEQMTGLILLFTGKSIINKAAAIGWSRGCTTRSQCVIENAWSFHINTPMSANIGPLIDQQDLVWFITK
jgi:hypothetical protein